MTEAEFRALNPNTCEPLLIGAEICLKNPLNFTAETGRLI